MMFRSLLMVLLVVVGIMIALKLGLIPSVVSKTVSKASKSVVGSVSKSASKSLELPNVNVDVLLCVFILLLVVLCMSKKVTEGFDCQEDFNIGYYSSIMDACVNEDSDTSLPSPCNDDTVNQINGIMECENIPLFFREGSAEFCSNYLNRCQSVDSPASEPPAPDSPAPDSPAPKPPAPEPAPGPAKP